MAETVVPQQLQALLSADPQWQQLVKQNRTFARDPRAGDKQRALEAYAQQIAAANNIPYDNKQLRIDTSGNIVPNGRWFDGWRLPVAVIGGLAGGYALAGMGAGGGAATTATMPASTAGIAGPIPGLATTTSLGTAGTIGSTAGTASTLGSLAKFLPAASKTLGAFSKSQTDNRGATVDSLIEQDRLKLQGNADTREGERDAMKKLNATSYILNGGSQFRKTPATQGIPDLGFGPQPISDAQRTGAKTLQEELLRRLQSGGFQPNPDINKNMKPGWGERLSGLAGMATGLYGAYTGGR